MKYEIEIDIQEVFDMLKAPEKTDFINDNLSEADDDFLIKEAEHRGLIECMIDNLSDKDLFMMIEKRFGDLINLIHE